MPVNDPAPRPRVRVEPITVHRDARGMVLEPLLPPQIAGHRNVHAVLTAPGAVRGNHFHRTGTETVAVVGPALVRVREGEEVRDIEVPDGVALRLGIPPGVPHAIRNTGDGPMLLVAFNTAEHDPSDPDVVREELL